MKPTPQQFRDWVMTLAAGHPIRVACEQSNDQRCADLCSQKTQPGYIPRRSLLSIITDYDLTWVLDEVVLHRLQPNGVGEPPSAILFRLCSQLRWVLEREGDDLRTPIARAVAGCGALAPFAADPIGNGPVSATTLRALVEAAEVKLSPVQVAFGFDAIVTPETVAGSR